MFGTEATGPELCEAEAFYSVPLLCYNTVIVNILKKVLLMK